MKLKLHEEYEQQKAGCSCNKTYTSGLCYL